AGCAPVSHYRPRFRLPLRGRPVTGRIFLKLIAGVLGILVIAAASVDYFATQVTSATYIQNLTLQLTDKCRMLALALPDPERADPAQVRLLEEAAGGRVTVVRSDGRVLIDSEADPAQMENHGARPEIARAFRGHVGVDSRRSATIGVELLYVAV